MTITAGRINKIFGSLEAAGFPRSFQKSLLPDWVTPEVLTDDAASSEIAAILAQRLGLRVSPLFAQTPHVESLRRTNPKYKRSIPNKSKNLLAATSVAVAVAEAVAAACEIEFKPFPETAAKMRTLALGKIGGKWLGLRSLLMMCWAHGVPVVYLDDVGDGMPKMDGMVVHTKSRPVIILSKASTLWAWQLFVLAHEMAHLALGHLEPDEILVDEELGTDSYAMEDSDPDERAADSFAIELLNGRKDATYKVSGEHVNANELADTAYRFGTENQIDPGHIVLNYAHDSGDWKVGMAAAKILQGNNPPATDVINEATWANIEQSALPDDTIEFLRKATGAVTQ